MVMAIKSKATRSGKKRGHGGFDYWELRLYVANWEPRSAEASTNLKKLCEQYLGGLYKIELVDLLKHPERSREDQIVAVPTLVRRMPRPEKRVIGTLIDREKVAKALEFHAVPSHENRTKPDRRERRQK
jgi:circadian clock protein KaiB